MKWLLKKYMAENHIETMRQLSEMTGIPDATLHDRCKKPTTIKVFEIVALDAVLHFSDEDIAKVARGQV